MEHPARSVVASSRNFLLQNLDPLEAKCAELRELLKGAEPLVNENDINQYITRDITLRSAQLYGEYLAPNMPILHVPTFKVSNAPAPLVLAVILGGACYSRDLIPPGVITKFAMGLLIMIESQTVSNSL